MSEAASRLRQDFIAIDEARRVIKRTGNAGADQELRQNAINALDALNHALLARLYVAPNSLTERSNIQYDWHEGKE